jgi:hypothetical protein
MQMQYLINRSTDYLDDSKRVAVTTLTACSLHALIMYVPCSYLIEKHTSKNADLFSGLFYINSQAKSASETDRFSDGRYQCLERTNQKTSCYLRDKQSSLNDSIVIVVLHQN